MSVQEHIAVEKLIVKWPSHTLTWIPRSFTVSVIYTSRVEKPSIAIQPIDQPRGSKIIFIVDGKKYTLEHGGTLILYADGEIDRLTVSGKIRFTAEGIYRLRIKPLCKPGKPPTWTPPEPLAAGLPEETVKTIVYGKTVILAIAFAAATGVIAWKLSPIKFTRK